MSGKGNFRKHVDRLNRQLPDPLSEEEEKLIADWLDKRDGYTRLDREQDESYLERVKAELYQHISNKIAGSKPQMSRRMWLRIAASVIFCAFIGIGSYLLTRSKGEKLIAVQNTGRVTKKSVLPDGSVLWLNAASKVRVPLKFDGKQRNVYLDEGEAFFDIAKDEKKPFFVHTPTLTIKVLGTAFNVKSYKQLEEVRVTVNEGMISVAKGGDELEKLAKNKELIFDKRASNYSVREVESQKLSRWREGEIYLLDAPLQDLILAMEHKYLVNIGCPDEWLDKERISIEIPPEQTLEEVMAVLAKIFNVQYDRTGKEVVIRPR